VRGSKDSDDLNQFQPCLVEKKVQKLGNVFYHLGFNR